MFTMFLNTDKVQLNCLWSALACIAMSVPVLQCPLLSLVCLCTKHVLVIMSLCAVSVTSNTLQNSVVVCMLWIAEHQHYFTIYFVFFYLHCEIQYFVCIFCTRLNWKCTSLHSPQSAISVAVSIFLSYSNINFIGSRSLLYCRSVGAFDCFGAIS